MQSTISRRSGILRNRAGWENFGHDNTEKMDDLSTLSLEILRPMLNSRKQELSSDFPRFTRPQILRSKFNQLIMHMMV